MDKLIILLLAGGLAYHFFSGEEIAPERTLSLSQKVSTQASEGTVGGPCKSSKCLIVYTAPWCPTSKAMHNTIISLEEELKQEGIEVQVVAGKSSPVKTKKYADTFPFQVFLDSKSSYYNDLKLDGVPSYVVTDDKGEVINRLEISYPNTNKMRQKLEL